MGLGAFYREMRQKKQQAYARHLHENMKLEKTLQESFLQFFKKHLLHFFPPLYLPQLTVKYNTLAEAQVFFMVLEDVLERLQQYCDVLDVFAQLYTQVAKDNKDYYYKSYLRYKDVLGNAVVDVKGKTMPFTFCTSCKKCFHLEPLIYKACVRMAREKLTDGTLTLEHIKSHWANFILCDECPMGGAIMLNTVAVYDRDTKKMTRQWVTS